MWSFQLNWDSFHRQGVLLQKIFLAKAVDTIWWGEMQYHWLHTCCVSSYCVGAFCSVLSTPFFREGAVNVWCVCIALSDEKRTQGVSYSGVCGAAVIAGEKPFSTPKTQAHFELPPTIVRQGTCSLTHTHTHTHTHTNLPFEQHDTHT